ncbi:MAG: MerR family transcriptional regulator [Saprospiraceae bacterium]|nr:MerR family transcriptional regulator [Saprospiraceae bacterium]MCB9321599.1 MerR family transcriptional regulator [Lewinellaceae bacterium]
MYSLKDLERLLHIKAQTLRNWEKRYNLISPCRTDQNCRCYTEEDFALLSDITLLKSQGYKLCELAEKDNDAIQAIASQIRQSEQELSEHIDLLLDTLVQLNIERLEKLFDRLLQQYTLDQMIHVVILPLLDQFNLLWLTGRVYTIHERILGQLLKRKLYHACEELTSKASPNSPRILLYSPDNDHKSYLLTIIQYLLLRSSNYQVLPVGMQVTTDELMPVLNHQQADAVMVLLTDSFAYGELDAWIDKLQVSLRPYPLYVVLFPALRTSLKSHPGVKVLQGMDPLVFEFDPV